MSKRDNAYLRDIAESIVLIREYCQSGESTFLGSQALQDAVIRRLEIIGEASKRLSKEVREHNPGIPWKQICGLRDVLIHDYGMVNVRAVWNVVETDLPLLNDCVRNLLRAGSPEDP